MELPILTCFKCGNELPGEVDALIRHFRHVHGLTVTGAHAEMFVCGQGSCVRDFQLIRSFPRHILQAHYEILDNPNINRNAVNAGVEPVHVVEEEAMDVQEEENAPLPPIINDMPQAEEAALPDFHLLCLNLIVELRSKTYMTGVMLTDLLSEIDSLLKDTATDLSSKVQKFLSDRNLLDDAAAQALLESFDLKTPFKELRDLDKQINAVKGAFGFVEPVEIPLGTRNDLRLDRNTLDYVQTQVYDTCQYIPIIEALKLILKNQTVRDVIKLERPSGDGLISSFLDSVQYKCNAFYHNCDLLIRIQLYYDELEIVNPLGSKTGIHKLGCFYWSIQNVPRHINSSLDSIHVLVICYDQDRRKYGFRKILTNFLADLETLESTGVSMEVDGEEITFKATLTAFCGDGLSVHDVFELLGPSAGKFCRLCLISREDLHNGNFQPGIKRTREIHNDHVALINANPGNRQVMADSGVAGDCALHNSRNFHVSKSFVFDIVHDILEGVGPFELKLVLNQYICQEGLFNVEYLNNKIRTFNYGMGEIKNKPSANFSLASLRNLGDHKLKQRAMQTWLLLRSFPFLLAGKVQPGDKYMNLILLLLRIMEIVFAPTVRITLLPYLADLIEEHNNAFLTLFPTVHMINKHHHLVHYPECTLQFGPLLNYWCMRYEGKHNVLKQHAQVVCNFKNAPKTLIRICQFKQSKMYGVNKFRLNKIHCVSGKALLVEDTTSREDLTNRGYPLTKSVFVAQSLTLNGINYRPKMYVVLQSNTTREDNLPLFGMIVEIVVINNTEVFLKTKLLQCLYLDTDFNAYRVSNRPNDEFMFVPVSSLPMWKPVSLWTVPSPKRRFISLRHILV